MHLTDEEVEILARDGELPERAVHLDACAECTGRVAESRAFDEVLSHEETWLVLDEIETRRRSWPLQELEDRIRREDADAERMLGRLAASPYRFLWAILNVRKRRFRTGGVVRFLNRAAHEQCERDPLHARNLADAAIAVAESLPDDLYPASGVEHLRGVAWKERANACRYLGELDTALAALDRAERAFRRLLAPDLHLAIVAHIRSTVFFKLERYDEAITLGRSAAAEFARLGDTLRWAHAQLLIGGVLFECGQYAAAREGFEGALGVAEVRDDAGLKARVETNIANCEVELGHFGEASMRFVAMLPLYRELGMPTEVTRTHWSIGRLAVRAGRPAEGIRRLREARREAQELRMSDDAAKIALDLVEGLLLAGETKEIPRLLSQALRHFKEAGQPSAVVMAVTYLQQAAATNSLTPALVDFARRFITRAERDPALVFTPPM